MTPRLLILWSPPRCRSTAFFRMMIERGDFQAVHEPHSNLAEFGATEIGGTPVRRAADIAPRLRELSRHGPVFVKDTTDERYPEVLSDSRLLAEDAVHTFMVRDPELSIASYHALNPQVKRDQIGFGHLLELFEAVRATTGRTPVVLDAEELAADAEAGVRAFCAAVGLDHRPEALSWSAEDRTEWQRTGRWHVDVSRSQGFDARRRTPAVDVRAHPVLAGYLRHHQPIFAELHARRLRFAGPAATPASTIHREPVA